MNAKQAKKLKDNHTWFLGSISQFKQPNQKSREALDSRSVKIGSHELNIHSNLKDIACKISAVMVNFLFSIKWVFQLIISA